MNTLLVGLGMMGSKHFNTLTSHNKITSVTTVDPNNKSANFSDLEKALDKKYNFAVVATPTSLHEEVVVKLIESGIDTLLEKPISMSAPSAGRICEKAIEKNVKVCIGQIERFNPVVMALKEQIKNEQVVSIDFERLGPKPSRITDVGVDLDLAVHDFDLIKFLVDKNIKRIDRIFSMNKHHCKFQIELDNNISTTITSSWLFPFRRRGIEVLTDDCLYKANLIDKILYQYRKVDDACYNMKRVWVKNEDPLTLQLNSFIKYIESNKLGNLCNCLSAKEILECLLTPA